MTSVVLDAGAFIAVDRGDRAMAARLRVAQQAELDLRTTGIVVAQVWRDPVGKQANLARLLKSVDVIPVDEQLGRQAGKLLGRAGTNDPIDASIVAVATSGDRIVTSDPADITRLAATTAHTVIVVPC